MFKDDNKLSGILSKIEIVIAVILFVIMIVTCGLYIDVKMNGKASSLPQLSEADKRVLLRSVASESITYSDDLIEPVFVGVKNNGLMIAACPDNSSRRSFESVIYDSLLSLFAGSSVEITFENQDDRLVYIENLKNSNSYMLIGFYDNLPSSVFLPCMSQSYESVPDGDVYYVKHLFLLSDIDGNMYAIAVSSDNIIALLRPSESITFNKILAESYDVSDGYSYFEFEKSGNISPILTSTFMSNRYKMNKFATIYGKDKSAQWINNLFDVFSINSALVKEYSSKNNTVINFVEDSGELVVSDDGSVEYKSADNDGVPLSEFLGYMADDEEGYTFGDKIVAVKNIINTLNFGDGLQSYSVVGVEYDKDKETFVIYLKSFVEGIMISSNAYDAIFEIRSDALLYAKLYAYAFEELDDFEMILPQKYSNVLLGSTSFDSSEQDEAQTDFSDVIYCPMLKESIQDSGIYSIKWAKVTPKEEVDG